ncbi:MAG: glutathione peroxidase [Marinicaulis sp.]|nr:glutathione peroxidase [Marinicaulis sp.]NNL87906.1 glutathione peroxidase [Marinicaulis sp.]
MSEFYDFNIKTLTGKDADLSQYKGNVVLAVNVASKCGFTPQYEGLEKLYQEYKDDGFVILGFPCNQFGAQEPGEGDEIAEFCSVNYGVSFPIMEKIDVNGPDAHPLYDWMKKEKPGLAGTKNVKWNFTKFLIDGDGNVVSRFGPRDKPESIEKYVKKLV